MPIEFLLPEEGSDVAQPQAGMATISLSLDVCCSTALFLGFYGWVWFWVWRAFWCLVLPPGSVPSRMLGLWLDRISSCGPAIYVCRSKAFQALTWPLRALANTLNAVSWVYYPFIGIGLFSCLHLISASAVPASYVVGSKMAPAYRDGDFVITTCRSPIQVGDVILYQNQSGYMFEGMATSVRLRRVLAMQAVPDPVEEGFPPWKQRGAAAQDQRTAPPQLRILVRADNTEVSEADVQLWISSGDVVAKAALRLPHAAAPLRLGQRLWYLVVTFWDSHVGLGKPTNMTKLSDILERKICEHFDHSFWTEHAMLEAVDDQDNTDRPTQLLNYSRLSRILSFFW